MKRREFLKLAGSLGIAGTLPSVWNTAQAAELHTGAILVTFHMGGGWDHSSFADPRNNPNINHWADTQTAGEAGNLRYAPMAENAAFFNKYYRDMLVINGIDLQTNGHTAATQHRNTGNLMGGFPSLNELYAGITAKDIPMPFLRSGGYSGNIGLMPFTALPDETLLRTLVNPNFSSNGRTAYAETHMDILSKYQNERLTAQMADSSNLPRWQSKLNELQQARNGITQISALASLLPDSFDSVDLQGDRRGEITQLNMFLVLAAAGMTATGAFSTGGYDTHGDHDNRHSTALIRITRLIDYLWTKAETLGLADRLIVHLTSDVGRTPHYNSNNGKDHWSLGSDIIMKKNAPWTNRIVGASGATHDKIKINPQTLQIDEAGIQLRPKHIHTALRKLMNIDQNPITARYNLNAEDLPFFDPSVSTGIQV